MTMTDTPGAELAVRAQPVLPMAPEQARSVMQAYQETCKAILTSDDVQRVGDREFTKRSGFQKLGAAYGVSTEIVSQHLESVLRGEEEETEGVYVARAVVRAIHPSGRHAEGDGTCASNEKRFRKGDEKLEHSLMATAVTRATNRAISNLIAFGSISAEEAEASAPVTEASLPAWAVPAGDIPAVAHNLNRVLNAAGVMDTAVVSRVGNAVFDRCDKTFPAALAYLAELLADAVTTPTGTDEPAVVDGTTDDDTTTEQEAP
jgi:hypothetical protein